MKATGVVRKVDELGRIVLPIELRRIMDINIKDPIEIFVDDDQIILQKFSSNMACQITGEVSNDNFAVAGGKIVLSREGAKILLEELEAKMAANK
ncbi:AbrB/MazE/SpoVT family DNA-binding domain-containing protein [Fictibacillus sp. Mic-4]|uniref:AbrB/MazE/SpoVT family DNA-binding domain-containing protein n=1 Tax=Fictibacillus TaxID=1329200 RepID=UPI000421DCEA|nr:AbrB/MazE/SpoVT family DNA-binding domain-containing protein [Fictibacillus gelatini]